MNFNQTGFGQPRLDRIVAFRHDLKVKSLNIRTFGLMGGFHMFREGAFKIKIVKAALVFFIP